MITYRQATINDLTTLNQISWQSKAFWGYPEEWMEQWRTDLTITEEILNTQSVLLLEEDSTTIGFCVISEGVTQYEVEHLWILPAHIGKGLGKQLLNQALAQFTTLQKPIQVVADPNAESFYRRQGFETFKQLESSPAGRFLPVMKKANTSG